MSERTNERTNVYLYRYSGVPFSRLLASYKGYIINATEGSYFVTLIHNRYSKDTVFYSMSCLFLFFLFFFLRNDDCIWTCTVVFFFSSTRVILHPSSLSPSPSQYFYTFSCLSFFLPFCLCFPFVFLFSLFHFFLYIKESTKGESLGSVNFGQSIRLRLTRIFWSLWL